MDLKQSKIQAVRAGLTLKAWLARRAKGQKRCACCKKWQKLEQFACNQGSSDGRTSWCKNCTVARRIAWNRSHPSHRARGEKQPPPGHEERLRRYEERAAMELPLFEETT